MIKIEKAVLKMEFDELLNEFGLTEFQQSMDILFPKDSLSFEEIWAEVMKGNIIDALAKAVGRSLELNVNSFGSVRSVFIWLLILGIMGALLSNFVEIFDKSQVADLAFYFLYLMVSAVMLKCFFEISGTASETLENIVLFVKLMIPTYMIAVGVSAGTTTVTMYYELVIFIIYCIENILIRLVLPLISCHMMLAVVNGIWPKEGLGILTGVMKKAVLWILKAGMGVITGFGVIQALISPSLDSVHLAAFKKLVAAVPGVGDAAQGIMDIALASAVTVKNSIGVVLLVLLVAMCLRPLLEIFVIAFVLKLAAALMGIVSDKRITACADQTADTGFMMLRTVAAAMFLFLVSLSVTALSTNRIY